MGELYRRGAVRQLYLKGEPLGCWKDEPAAEPSREVVLTFRPGHVRALYFPHFTQETQL